MPNCKICGRPVVSGPVMHSECLEQLITEAAEQFCDSYCSWPNLYDGDPEQLQRECCDSCPMEQLMKLAGREGVLEPDCSCMSAHDAAEMVAEALRHQKSAAREAPTVTPPPNDPLTLEELRGMDGEPVWVRNHCSDHCKCRVIASTDEHFTFFSDGGAKENRSYGSYWTAYRRRPEEG